MGWFEGQINERQDADLQLLEDSFVKVAGIINGKRFAEQYSDSNIITKTAIDAYTGEEDFARGNAAFIEAFRTSFSKISTHYRVEVPTSEIAYVHDYIHSKRATREHAPELASLADE